MNHHLVGSNNVYDSWKVLCEDVLSLAEEEAMKRLNALLLKITEEIADEIIETAVEYEP